MPGNSTDFAARPPVRPQRRATTTQRNTTLDDYGERISRECQNFCVRDFCEVDLDLSASRLWHQRHGQQVCLAAPSGQAPKPRSGAPQARGLTAKVRAKRQLTVLRCRSSC
jgi:hypothetical protein